MLLQHTMNVLSGIFVGAMVSRHYGPELFGIFSIVSFWGALVGSIAGLGVGDLLAAQLMKKKPAKEGLFYAVQIIRCATFLIVWLLIYLYLQYTKVDSVVIQGYTILFVSGFFSSLNLYVCIARSHQRNDVMAILGMVSLLISMLFRTYIVVTDKGLIYLYWDAIIKTALDFVLLVFFLRKKKMLYPYAKPEWRLGFLFVRKSLPLMLSTFVALLGANIGLLILDELIGKEGAGRFGAVMRVYNLVLFLGHAISSNLFYYMESSGLEIKKFMEQHVVVILRSLAALSYAFMIASTLFIRPFLDFLFGKEYSGIGMYFTVISTGVAFLWMTIPAHLKQLSEAQTKKILFINIAVLIFNWIATYASITLFGEFGAYIVFPVTSFAAMVATFWLSGMKSELRLVMLSFLKPIPDKKLLMSFIKA
jgi:O-antigen/teichoic acid export membrane protein